MKKIVSLAAVGLIIILATVITISCSSGGGGGDGDNDVAPPATLDRENVDRTLDYVVQTIPGCSQGEMITANQVILDAVSTMRQQVVDKKVRLSPLSDTFQPTEAIDPPLEGLCGGTITGDVTANETTGNISGDISLNNYCMGETGSSVLIDGALTFSGNLDPDSGELTSLKGSSNGITITVDEAGEQRSYSTSFNASLSMSGGTISITVKSFTFADDTEGTEVKLQDFIMTVTEGDTTTSVTISGTIDVTDEGSVQFETVGPLTVSDDGETVAGTIVMTGADNTHVQVTIDNGVLMVQADTDGDGAFDYTPENLDCTGVAVDDIL